jgi:HEAT repeat protein
VIDNEPSPFVTELFKSALLAPAAKSDKAFRFELIAALVRHRDASVVPELEVALLSNHDTELNNARANMIYALQEIDPSSSGPILIQALRLPEARMRLAAVMAIKSAPSEAGIEALFGTLDDPDAEVQFQAIETLSVLLHKSNCARYSTAGDGAFRACAEGWRKFATAWKSPSN